MNKSSKIYVAGHRGLVGSALVKCLQAGGYENIVTRTHVELDLTDQAAVVRFFDAERPEYVFLAAAKVGGIAANNVYRADFIYQNTIMECNVIHSSYVYGVKKLLFLGSTCIYPRDAVQPMAEDALLGSPLEYTNEPYAIAKIAGLKMCESYNLQYGTNFIAVMPTNLYGPNDNFNLETSHVLPAMIRKVFLGKCLSEGDMERLKADFRRMPVEGVDGSEESEMMKKLGKYGVRLNAQGDVEVEIWGTGAPLREFLWSEDMAAACVYVMERVDWTELKGDGAQVRNCHINIGTGMEVSIRTLAETIAKKIGFKGQIVFNAEKPDGTMRKLTDPTKLHKLGWRHTVELEQGVEKLFNWYIK